MIEHQQTIINIKSDVLSLCVSSARELNSFSEYFSLFKQCLNQHFDIEECCFLSYEGDVLKPLTKADLSMLMVFHGHYLNLILINKK